MQLAFIHPKLGRVTVPSTQVVVLDDTGRALAVSYEVAPGTIIHSDLNDADFSKVCQNIGMVYEKPETLALKQ